MNIPYFSDCNDGISFGWMEQIIGSRVIFILNSIYPSSFIIVFILINIFISLIKFFLIIITIFYFFRTIRSSVYYRIVWATLYFDRNSIITRIIYVLLIRFFYQLTIIISPLFEIIATSSCRIIIPFLYI